MYFVYAIKSFNKKYIYVGMTDNSERRFSEHNNGREKTTGAYKPFKLIFLGSFSSRELARQKEKKLKSGFGKKYLKLLI